MHFKRLLSLIMAVSMLLSLSPLAYAEYSTPVTVTSEAAIFNVSVPTVLPVSVSDHGLITTASDAAITNNSWGPICIAGLSVTGSNGWVTTDYNSANMAAEKVDTHKAAMDINGSKTTGANTVNFVATGFSSINGAGGTCAITYDAKLPAQSTAISNAGIMNILFTIAWNTVSTADPSEEPTPNALTPGDTKLATLSFDNADPVATEVTVTSSDENVATASVDTPVTTTSTNDSTNNASLSVFSLVDTAYASDFTGLPVSKAVGIKIKAVGPGTCTITGMLADSTEAQMQVTVNEKIMTGIKVVNAPTKTDYIEGNTFDPTGMVVHAVYNNGSEETISDYEIGTAKLSLGQSVVSLSYNGKTCTVPISIRAKQLLSIAVSKAPTKTSYVEGQSFDPTGMVITGSYDNGDAEAVTDYTMDSKVALGQTGVTISFGGKTCAQEITVVGKSPIGISVKTPATRTIYTVGDTFDSTGLVLNLNYDNGTSSELSSGFTVSADISTTTTTSATITYGNLSCTMPIVVSGPDWDTNPKTSAQVTAANLIFNATTGTISKGSTNPTGILNIPSSVDGVRVTNIGSSAFESCSGLTAVTIPNSVANIEMFAFNACSGIKSITIPDSVTSNIGCAAFYNCSSLTTVKILSISLACVGSSAFKNLKAGSTIYVKNSTIKALFTSSNYTTGNTTITVDANLS